MSKIRRHPGRVRATFRPPSSELFKERGVVNESSVSGPSSRLTTAGRGQGGCLRGSEVDSELSGLVPRAPQPK